MLLSRVLLRKAAVSEWRYRLGVHFSSTPHFPVQTPLRDSGSAPGESPTAQIKGAEGGGLAGWPVTSVLHGDVVVGHEADGRPDVGVDKLAQHRHDFVAMDVA